MARMYMQIHPKTPGLRHESWPRCGRSWLQLSVEKHHVQLHVPGRRSTQMRSRHNVRAHTYTRTLTLAHNRTGQSAHTMLSSQANTNRFSFFSSIVFLISLDLGAVSSFLLIYQYIFFLHFFYPRLSTSHFFSTFLHTAPTCSVKITDMSLQTTLTPRAGWSLLRVGMRTQRATVRALV